MKKLLLFCLLGACTLEVPVDEVEIPPIENTTNVVVRFPDGFGIPMRNAAETKPEPECTYQHFPDYYGYGASVLGCTGDVRNPKVGVVCCTWLFPEEKQACEERWCRDVNNACGWELNSWDCYSY